MPTIRDNQSSWDREWGHEGDDWSQAWGSTGTMWRHSVLPRIGRHLPCDSLLEIAPGRGRVTELLLPHCQRYLGIDLAQACVDACRTRFADQGKARFERNDGLSLAIAADASVDFAFSWDSLVHADTEVLSAYAAELARALRPGGTAFLHHSNLGAFVDPATGEPTVDNPHWRDATVSAETVRAAADRSGLTCLAQELVQWGVPFHSDCFTLLRRPEAGAPTVEPARIEHPDFNAEMQLSRALDQAYWR